MGDSANIRKASPQTKQGAAYGFPGSVTSSGKAVINLAPKSRNNGKGK